MSEDWTIFINPWGSPRNLPKLDEQQHEFQNVGGGKAVNFNTELLEVLCRDKICFKQRLNSRVLKAVGLEVCRNIANLFRDSNVHALV